MLQIRRARPSEAGILTALAVKAEAHWGFDERYMNSFREQYAVSSAFIEVNHVFVAAEGEDIRGFFALLREGSAACLEFMYVDPGSLGCGIGRRLWNHMTAYCRLKGWEEVQLVCGPEPQAFYLKMGASLMGEEASKVVPGRRILRLRVAVPQQVGQVECVAFILVQEGRILAERRKLTKESDPGAVSIPGGHVEPGESLEQALERELGEELGIVPRRWTYLGAHDHRARERQKVHYFAVEAWTGSIECHEADELLWIPVAETERFDLEVDREALGEYLKPIKCLSQ